MNIFSFIDKADTFKFTFYSSLSLLSFYKMVSNYKEVSNL